MTGHGMDPFRMEMTESEAGNYAPLALAFIGDAVFELAVRTMIMKEGHARPNDMNRRKNELVKAPAQSVMLGAVAPILTAEERNICRRGRNAKSFTMAKNATMAEYRRATAFEALLGYLYLQGRLNRMTEIIECGIAACEGR